jgi:hypothetical protein
MRYAGSGDPRTTLACAHAMCGSRGPARNAAKGCLKLPSVPWNAGQ